MKNSLEKSPLSAITFHDFLSSKPFIQYPGANKDPNLGQFFDFALVLHAARARP